MLMVLAAFIVGVVPLILYTLSLWWLDRYEREPGGLLLAAFLWGFLPAAVGSLLLGLVLDYPLTQILRMDNLAYTLTSSGLLAPLVEEGMKGLGLLILLVAFEREVDSPFDSFLYAAAIGFGFGAVENLLTLAAAVSPQELLLLGLVRSLVFGLNHALYTGSMGLAVGLARRQQSWLGRAFLSLCGFLAAVSLHAFHNAGLSLVPVSPLGFGLTAGSDLIGVIGLAAATGYALRREAGVVRRYLKGEVALGHLAEGERLAAASLRRRWSARWQRLRVGDIPGWRRLGRFHQACAELAFARRAHEQGRPGAAERVADSRRALAAQRSG